MPNTVPSEVQVVPQMQAPAPHLLSLIVTRLRPLTLLANAQLKAWKGIQSSLGCSAAIIDRDVNNYARPLLSS
jgi:hypothetical protein